MPRIKHRDFSGGLHVTAPADHQPRNSLRANDNTGQPIAGRLFVASPPVARWSAAGITVDGMFRLRNRAIIEGTTGGVHVLRRNTADAGTTFATITLPASYGAQPAVALVANSKCTGVIAPPNDGKTDALFLCDVRNDGPNLLKITDPTTPTVSRWGILPLSSAQMDTFAAAPGTQSEKFINTAAATDPLESAADWTLASADEDALSAFAAIDTVASPAISGNALRLRVGKDDAAQITRAFGSDIDLSTFGGGVGASDQDYIQFWIRTRRPSRIENLEIAFDTTPAGDFTSEYFSREITFKIVRRRQKRDLIALGDLVKVGEEQAFLEENADKPTDLTYDGEMGNQQISVAKNTWTRVTLPKSSFEKVGAGADWANVRAIRITVTANKEGRTAVFLDRLTMNGGTGMVGQYLYAVTLLNSATGTRSNPVIMENGVLNNVSVMNGTDQAVLERQPANVQWSGTLTFDPQVDRLEIWRTLGNGKAYFRSGYIQLTTPGTAVATTIVDRTSDYIGLHDIQTAEYTQVVASGTFHGFAILDGSLELPLDNDSPNDPAFRFQDAVGIHVGRMWWTRNVSTTDAFGNTQDAMGQVFYSPAGRYEAVQGFVQVTSGSTDRTAKLTRWNDRLFLHTIQGFYEILGTDEPFIAHRVEGAPGTSRPGTVIPTPEGIFWVGGGGGQGIYLYNGQYTQCITDKDLWPLFAREDVPEYSLSTYDPCDGGYVQHLNEVWFTSGGVHIGSEGNGSAEPTLCYNFETRTWRTRSQVRFVFYSITAANFAGGGIATFYPAGPAPQVLGVLGTTANTIHDLEPRPFDTTGVAQTVTIVTPATRVGPGQLGILRKLYIEMDRGTETYTPSVIIDGVTTALATISTLAGRQVYTYNLNMPGQVFAVRLVGLNINNPGEVFGIELDIYVPGETIGDSGLAGNG